LRYFVQNYYKTIELGQDETICFVYSVFIYCPAVIRSGKEQ